MLIVIGPVCSGKTTFGEVAKSMGHIVFEMGDEVRQLYAKSNSNKPITDFVTNLFNTKGKNVLARRIVEKVRKTKPNMEETVIVGPRTVEEVDYIKKELGPCRIIEVYANERERFRRWNTTVANQFIQTLSYEEFIQRNHVEDKWGLALLQTQRDDILVNEDPIDIFREIARSFLDNAKKQKEMMLGRFEIIKSLGAGQSKETWKAVDHKLGKKPVVIKKVRITGEGVKALLEEARIAGPLKHENIAEILDVYEGAGILVEEFVDGKDLEKLMKEIILSGKRLSVSESKEILKQLLEAVSFAHKSDRVHGDIKPANIIIRKEGKIKVKLTDFEVGRILSEVRKDAAYSEEQLKRGSINYMAPELLRGKPPTKKSDLFSLGIVAYLLFTHRNPFLDPSGLIPIPDCIGSKSYQPLPLNKYSPALPKELNAIVFELLERDVDKRCNDVGKIKDRFTRVCMHTK